jgi:chromate transporter
MAAHRVSETHQVWAAVVTILTHIGGLAFISFGGFNTVLPAIHRLAVDQAHWMTDRDFASLFAIAQASPGPNVLVITLVGLKAAGIPGAIAATLALTVPTSLLAFVVVRVWDRFREARWRKATQAGLLPVTIGFITASGYIIVRAADHSLAAFLVSIATLVVAAVTKINPLWMFAVGGLLGWAGWM